MAGAVNNNDEDSLSNKTSLTSARSNWAPESLSKSMLVCLSRFLFGLRQVTDAKRRFKLLQLTKDSP
jgi:hypothetical protein